MKETKERHILFDFALIKIDEGFLNEEKLERKNTSPVLDMSRQS
jgi:hypothetical protein